jgi:hypothetical protein
LFPFRGGPILPRNCPGRPYIYRAVRWMTPSILTADPSRGESRPLSRNSPPPLRGEGRDPPPVGGGGEFRLSASQRSLPSRVCVPPPVGGGQTREGSARNCPPPRRGEGDNSDASRRLRTPFSRRKLYIIFFEKRGVEDLRVASRTALYIYYIGPS